MKISALKIRTLETETKLIGVVSITLDDMFAVHDVKILSDGEKRFLAMPSKKMKNEAFRDIVHPINASVRATVENLVFGAYDDCVGKGYAGANYKLREDFIGSLFEQSVEDFSIETTMQSISDSVNI